MLSVEKGCREDFHISIVYFAPQSLYASLIEQWLEYFYFKGFTITHTGETNEITKINNLWGIVFLMKQDIQSLLCSLYVTLVPAHMQLCSVEIIKKNFHLNFT